MKNAFTMVELIFVIVIIGILSAIAIPKMASTTLEAKKAHVQNYIDMLNRTVGATMYSNTLNSENIGKITGSSYCGKLSNMNNIYMDPIPEVTIKSDCTLVSNISIPFSSGTFIDGTTISQPTWTYKY